MKTDLPKYISPDGHELWDWAANVSDHIHRQAEIANLRASIRDLNPRCGTCKHWMKSSECPRESSLNGRPKGPSMQDIPCNIHKEESWVTSLRQERENKIAKLSTL